MKLTSLLQHQIFPQSFPNKHRKPLHFKGSRRQEGKSPWLKLGDGKAGESVVEIVRRGAA